MMTVRPLDVEESREVLASDFDAQGARSSTKIGAAKTEKKQKYLHEPGF